MTTSAGQRCSRIAHPTPFLAAILTCCGFAGAVPLSAAEKRPNILFVLADDWGRHASCYRNPAQPSENDVIATPHIDRVAREGMLFNNAPFCHIFGPIGTHRGVVTGSGKALWGLDPGSFKGKLPARDAVIVGRERHEPDVRSDRSPYPVRAIRTKDFEYVRNFKPERWPCGDPSDRSFPGDPLGRGGIISWILAHRDEPSVRPVFDLCYGKRMAEELYDLRQDPFMMKNIAADPACSETKRELGERLMKVLRGTQDPRLEDAFARPPYVAPASVQSGGKKENDE